MEGLCQRCCALRLDVSKSGCQEDTDVDGHIVLKYESEEIEIDYQVQDIYPEFTALHESAIEGCYFCSFLEVELRKCIGEHPQVPPGETGTMVRITRAIYATPSVVRPPRPNEYHNRLLYLIIHFEVSGAEELDITESIQFDVVADATSEAAEYFGIPRRTVSRRMFEPQGIARLRGWLEQCDMEHSLCGFADRSTLAELPTRLIDIQNHAIGECRLVDTRNFPRGKLGELKYIAYSYCWGDPSTGMGYITTRENIQERLNTFAISELPTAFRELIILASSLGIRFLWIDAICIIQKDEQDWQTESVRMKLVYENAYLTIAASSTSSPNESIFERRDYETDTSVFKMPNGARSFYLVPTIVLWWDHNNISSIYADIQESKWNSRGWTMQERALSGNVLYIGSRQFYLQCHSALREESLDLSLGVVMSQGFSKSIEDEGMFLETWYGDMGEFNTREFTNKSDKLPAISGLAESAIQARQGNYLAGLWESDFESGLLWAPAGPRGSRLAITESYCAPSWSWASYDGPITWPFQFTKGTSTEFACEIDEVRVMAQERNGLGKIHGGYVKTSGPIQAVGLRKQNEGEAIMNDQGFDCDLVVSVKKKEFAAGRIDTQLFFDVLSRMPIPIYAFFVAALTTRNTSELAQGTSGSASDTYSIGLLLTIAGADRQSVRKPVFRRIGIWISHGDIKETLEYGWVEDSIKII